MNMPPDPMNMPPDPMASPKKSAAAEGSAAQMVMAAKTSGALKPLEDVMKEEGWPMDAGVALLLAQKKQAPGTQGKTPEELAQMLRDDPGVYKDLEALQPGGALDAFAKKVGDGEAPPMSDDDAEMESAMGGYFKDSKSMQDEDPKKGLSVLKKLGAKSPKDLDADVGMKSDFMARMK